MKEEGFASIVGIVLALAIVCLLAYFSMKAYRKESPADKDIPQPLREQGVESSHPMSVLGAAKANVDRFNEASKTLQKQAAEPGTEGQ